jgi:hypothetical protein
MTFIIAHSHSQIDTVAATGRLGRGWTPCYPGIMTTIRIAE